MTPELTLAGLNFTIKHLVYSICYIGYASHKVTFSDWFIQVFAKDSPVENFHNAFNVDEIEEKSKNSRLMFVFVMLIAWLKWLTERANRLETLPSTMDGVYPFKLNL